MTMLLGLFGRTALITFTDPVKVDRRKHLLSQALRSLSRRRLLPASAVQPS